jgi:hypothetical protein
MSQLKPAELDNLLMRLSPAQIIQPYSVLDDLYNAFNLGQLRSTLHEMKETCLTDENEAFQNAEKREDLLNICQSIEKALEAIYLIMDGRVVDLDSSYSQDF